MVDQAALLKDLQKQVKLLEDDLRERGQDPTAIKGTDSTGEPETFDASLKCEYQRARDAERTAVTEAEWREGQITQAAVAWVLSTVFLRFCEDNGLLEQPFIAGPKDERDRYGVAQELKEAWVLQGRSEDPDAPERTDRDWLEHAFEQMSVSSVMAGLFDKQHNPMWTITPSHSAAKQIIDFWRAVGEDGHLIHDFTDPEWNTRFLGDLYQDLSEATRKKYALLQTPEFVEEFILDYTLEPAIEEFGLDGNRIYQKDNKGFRLIDPTCGSGHFLLGAFHRLLGKWREAEPGASGWDLISRSLRSVHGVDKNPYAVAIARFRLFIAAMKEGGIYELSASTPEWPIVVASGDSLLHGRGASGVQDSLFLSRDQSHSYATEDFHEYVAEFDLLGRSSYHAVVGNPPYVQVSDDAENRAYRASYASCHREYSLSIPFAERFFNLARRAPSDGPSGFVGKITTNTFMRREFGKKLIEVFFRNDVRLTHVIDSSGAHVPGHGTPTVVLFGRNEKNSHRSTVRAALGIRGEPNLPKNPAEGLVWNSIVSQMSTAGDSESSWISVEGLPWSRLSVHPWNLSGGGASRLRERIEAASSKTLSDVALRVGFFGMTHADDVMQLDKRVWQRMPGSEGLHRPLVVGESVRDWTAISDFSVFFPYDKYRQLISVGGGGEWSYLWRYRALLGSRATFGKKTYFSSGKTWYEWHQIPRDVGAHPWSIPFSFVSTHSNFSLEREGRAFKQSAPLIKLPVDVAEQQHLSLLGVLNSSLACFWLKQVCHDKGSQSGSGGFMHDEWEVFYEFTGTKVKEFPLAGGVFSSEVEKIDALAQELVSVEPASLTDANTPSRVLVEKGRMQHESVLGRMAFLQEELDWKVYNLYEIISDDQLRELVISDKSEIPMIKAGERAFEIVLARKVAAGETTTVWFNRHRSDPITEIPDHWPDAYKKVVAKRIELIESDKNINLLERPEYKRRWQSEPWEKKQKAALKSWLLDKCEDQRLWFSTDDYGDERAHPLSLRALANRVRDLFPEAAEVAALYDSTKDFGEVIEEIVKTEHVPYLAGLRYKDTGMRKRADWEHVWDLQRQEDKLNADLAEGEKEHRLDIPVPPKYTSADFRRNEYWSNRGKLDVPKERFVSYPGAETDTDSTLLLGWAGWDHAQQADALGTLSHERLDELGWGKDEDTRDRMVPLLAGMLELLPWVQQWHTEADEYGETPADHLRADLAELRDTTGITESEMKAWRPQAARGRKKA